MESMEIEYQIEQDIDCQINDIIEMQLSGGQING